VSPSAFVDESAQVIGNVHIGSREQHLDERGDPGRHPRHPDRRAHNIRT
jgi:hypothetical protein